VFGDAHPRSVKAINNPPGIYLAKRDFATAEHLLQQASAITRTAFGDGHPETALSLDNLGELYHTSARAKRGAFGARALAVTGATRPRVSARRPMQSSQPCPGSHVLH
jgi:hypothetical protein